MKFETVKTFILTVLVGLSLLLTFGLWTYQPNDDLLYDTSYVNEVDLGGVEETKHNMVELESMIFHREGQFFGYTDPINSRNLYKDIQEWRLDHFNIREAHSIPDDRHQVELVYPSAIPLEILPMLFTLDEDQDNLPGWSFQHVYITFDGTDNTLNIQFLSVDGRKQATAVIGDSDKYSMLWAAMSELDGLTEYMQFTPADTPIYIPKNEVDMTRRSLAVESIDPKRFINALFSNPSTVSANYGEAYYTDGQRGLSVLQDGRRMEFINPIHPNYDERMTPGELLDKSIQHINEHKGWTDEYKLARIDKDANSLLYRMYYSGYPVFNHSGLSEMEQKWRNHELYQYRRPLFKLDNTLGGDKVTLPSGNEIADYLENQEKYQPKKIRDIRVGYHLAYSDSVSYSLTLEPAWYVNYNGHWQQLSIEGGE
jgi:regulatory protein YycH of two-component signal transduction system YycFG